MADLEADVDDLDDADWEDEENGDDLNHEERHISQIDGTDAEGAQHTTPAEKESLVKTTSKLLSVRNPSDPTLVQSSFDPSSAAPADQPFVSTSPHLPSNSLLFGSSDRPNGSISSSSSSIINRRNASRITATQQSADDPPTASSAPKPDENNGSSSNFSNYLRPITPTQSIVQEEDITPNGSPLVVATTPTGADLAHEGPMTPTNNAGPFVFDGSAGRAAGRRTVAGMVQDTGSLA